MSQQINLENFNIVNACLGGFTLILGVVSFIVKERLYITEPIPATLFGFVFKEASWPHPDEYGDVAQISRDFARLVLGIQLMLAGVHLPGKYLKRAWQGITVLLVPVMTIMWLASALIIKLLFPLSWLESLIIGSCITPTDPVLSGAIVHGKFADHHVPKRLQDIILAESGANDGFGYPFLFLALAITRYTGVQIAKEWLVYTVCYEILMSIAYGAVIGFLGQEIIGYAKRHGLIDRESYFLSAIAIALFTIGTAGMIGTDDLLACFIAGNAFTWNDQFRLDTKGDSLLPTVDMILNLGIFTWIGATVPWSLFNTATIPVWRYIVYGVCIMAFRRIPAVLLCYKIVPEIHTFREALFCGYFGPIGVGALFYLLIALEEMQKFPNDGKVTELATPIVYFAILSSIIVHGFSIPIIGFILNFKAKKRHLGTDTDATIVANENQRIAEGYVSRTAYGNDYMNDDGKGSGYGTDDGKGNGYGNIMDHRNGKSRSNIYANGHNTDNGKGKAIDRDPPISSEATISISREIQFQ